MGGLKHFDPEILHEVIQLDAHGAEGLLEKLVSDYGANFHLSLKAMQTAINSLDYKTLERHAHSLKSSSKLLGLPLLGTLCAEIEHEARGQKINPSKQNLLEEEFKIAFPELLGFTKNRKTAA